MPTPINAEFENLNRGRMYPFSDEASLYDTSGIQLPDDFIVDAMLYPESGDCYLTSITKTDDGATRITISSETNLYCDFRSGDRRAEVYSSKGVHSGVLVLGESADSIADNPTAREFENLPFSFGCQFVVGTSGVSSVNVAGVDLSGDISFKSASDALVVNPVATENVDGSMNLRFDIGANTSKAVEGIPGIRKIYVLRKPGSLLNVFDKDGKPYLFLTRTGLSDDASLIGRNYICSYRKQNKGAEEYKNRTYKDDCGRDTGNSSGEVVSSCVPWSSRTGMDDYLNRYDPIKKEMYVGTVPFSTIYGYNYIPSINRFTAPSTVTWFIVEAYVHATFFVNNGVVLANAKFTLSEGARRLFYVDYGDGKTADYSKMVSAILRFKPGAHMLFYNYMMTNSHGGLGFLNEDSLKELCRNKGWTLDDNEVYDYEGIQATDEEIRNELREAGLTSPKLIYTVRARDFFEHFGCKNWEVSSEDALGNEIRHLVGWSTPSTFFSADNSYSTFTGDDGVSVPLPKWIVSRYVWWKKYSKNGNQMRHFIVPKDRGLVIYTGDYYFKNDPSLPKESSYTSWTCDNIWNRSREFESTGLYGMSGCTMWLVISDTMHKRLYAEYDQGYDPTYGDSTFYAYTTNDIIDGKTAVNGISIDDMDFASQRYNNRVTKDTLVSQPADDSPINEQDGDPSMYYSNSWKGPFEYEYGRLYTPGVGYTPTPSENEKENNAIKADIVCAFEITEKSSNRFDFDVTDLTSTGMVYDNPIHIGLSESTEAPETVSIDDPSDITDVVNEMKKLTTYRTSGNGIEISIPGLGV